MSSDVLWVPLVSAADLLAQAVPSATIALLLGLLVLVTKVLQLYPLLGVGQNPMVFLHYRNLRITAPGHWLRCFPINTFSRILPWHHSRHCAGCKYPTQPLLAPLRGLRGLRDPFSPLKQLGAAQESWPWLTLLPDLALLPSVLGSGCPHAGVGQPARLSPLEEPQMEARKAHPP